MEASIESQFERLEAQRSKFTAQLEAWSSEQLRIRPWPDAWCALEVLDHVNRTESSIFVEMRRNAPDSLTVGVGGWLRSSLMNLLMRSNARFKIPSKARHILPGEIRELGDLTAEWDLRRHAMREFLDVAGREMARMRMIRHPVGGWMTLDKTFGFLRAHVRHHEFQLKRIQRKLDRPGS